MSSNNYFRIVVPMYKCQHLKAHTLGLYCNIFGCYKYRTYEEQLYSIFLIKIRYLTSDNNHRFCRSKLKLVRIIHHLHSFARIKYKTIKTSNTTTTTAPCVATPILTQTQDHCRHSRRQKITSMLSSARQQRH